MTNAALLAIPTRAKSEGPVVSRAGPARASVVVARRVNVARLPSPGIYAIARKGSILEGHFPPAGLRRARRPEHCVQYAQQLPGHRCGQGNRLDISRALLRAFSGTASAGASVGAILWDYADSLAKIPVSSRFTAG